MLLPLALALVTAMALVVVIAPLMKGLSAAPPRLEFDRAVYRDQLGELERDRARGLIGEREAETARLEIERRLLVADRADGGDRAPPREGRALPIAAGAVALVLAAGAGALYSFLGSPGVPDLPAVSRAATSAGAADDLQKTAQSLEAQVQAKPNDAESWASLARTEAGLRDWQKTVDAYTHAVSLADRKSVV